MIDALQTTTGDYDLSANPSVLTHTPSATDAKRVQVVLEIGTDAKGLSGEGGNFGLTITVGGQVQQPGPQEIEFGIATRAGVTSADIVVPAGAEVEVSVNSPNSGDDDVTVTARLYDVLGKLDAAVSSRIADADKPTNWGSLSIDGSGQVTAGNMRGTDGAFTDPSNRIDATISSRASSSDQFKVGTEYRWDNGDGKTRDVTVNEVP